MKIIYFHNSPLSSEKANVIQVKAMCNAMVRSNHDVTLSIPSNSTSKEDDNNKYDHKFKIHYRKFNRKLGKLGKYLSVKQTRNILKKERPDLCYVRSPLLLLQVISTSSDVIYESHNSKLHLGSKLLDTLYKKLLIHSLNSGRVKQLIAISDELRNYWINQGVNEDKVITVHDGIDPIQFKEKISKEKARKILKLPQESNIITYVGSLDRNRNLDHILLLAKHIPDALFVVVGGPEHSKIKFTDEAINMEINNVIFTGRMPNEKVPRYLYASDILLGLWSNDLPHIKYFSPLKLFEYMAAERFVVVHGFKTIKEVIQHGVNGILVEPESFESLLNECRKVIEGEYSQTIPKKSRSDVFDKYTWDKRVKYIFSKIDIPI